MCLLVDEENVSQTDAASRQTTWTLSKFTLNVSERPIPSRFPAAKAFVASFLKKWYCSPSVLQTQAFSCTYDYVLERTAQKRFSKLYDAIIELEVISTSRISLRLNDGCLKGEELQTAREFTIYHNNKEDYECWTPELLKLALIYYLVKSENSCIRCIELRLNALSWPNTNSELFHFITSHLI